MPMLEKVRATILKYNMFEVGSSVAVGVSGGADSCALLHILLRLQDEFGIKVKAAHLNHKLRGDESGRDQAFVTDLCKRLHVELAVESADVAAIARDRRLSIEEAGRNARYDFFARCGCDKIAVAHSLNDSVETLLLNLARGAALRGLCGIPPKRGNVIRPLIECGRDEIEAYCESHGLKFVTDATNLSDDFARNKIRHHAIPAILSVNAGFWNHAAGTLEALRQDADFLDSLATREDEALRGVHPPLPAHMRSRDAYLLLEKPMRYRVLSRLLSPLNISVDGARLARLDGIAAAGSGAEQLSEGYFFKSNNLRFGVEEAGRIESFCIPVNVPENGEALSINVFSDKKLRLMNTDYEYYEENIKYVGKGLKNALDCDKIVRSLILRQKLPGDSVRLERRNCTKTLRKLFQEHKLTARQRERLFVLADDAGVVWVEGFGTAERAAVSDNTNSVLYLEVMKNDEK